MSDLSLDVRYATRALRSSPGLSLAAILTLALGIGMTTSIFSVMNGILLKPLPFPEPDRLISVEHRSKYIGAMNASPALYLTYRDHNRTFGGHDLGGGASDAAGSGRDQRNLVLEAHRRPPLS